MQNVLQKKEQQSHNKRNFHIAFLQYCVMTSIQKRVNAESYPSILSHLHYTQVQRVSSSVSSSWSLPLSYGLIQQAALSAARSCFVLCIDDKRKLLAVYIRWRRFLGKVMENGFKDFWEIRLWFDFQNQYRQGLLWGMGVQLTWHFSVTLHA